ncbi:hypothetical protein EAE96_007224 [Botrytis aclada]|nr:hypothetical protein EAE96_007224 [Botrytis aclada]
MVFQKVFRSVTRVFSTKAKNKQNTTEPKKLTKGQKPSNGTNTARNRIKNIVDFLTGSRSRRHSTESAPESATLVDSSNPPSTGNHTVETFEQVSEHAGAENATSYNIDNGLTSPSPSITQTVSPVLMAIAGSNQSIENIPVLNSNVDDINNGLFEVADAAGPIILSNNDVEVIVDHNSVTDGKHSGSVYDSNTVDDVVVEPESKSLKLSVSRKKTNTDIPFFNTDLPVESFIDDLEIAGQAVSISNDNNTENDALALVSTGLSINVPENYQLAFTPLDAPNEDGGVQVVVEVFEPEVSEPIRNDISTLDSIQIPSAELSQSMEAIIQSSEESINDTDGSAIQDESITSAEESVLVSEESPVAFPDQIDGYHLSGLFAAATTVTHRARSFYGGVFTASQPDEQALNEDDNTEYVVRQRRNSAPGNLISPDSHYPTGRRASLTRSDADNEAMFNDPNNYIVHDDSDMYIEPQLNIYPSVSTEPTATMVTAPIGVPAVNASLQTLAPEIFDAHTTDETVEVVSEPQLLNEPDSVEQEVFMSELSERLSLELANREVYLTELRNTFPVEQDSSDAVNQEAEEVTVSQKVNQLGETHAEEIVRMYRIPPYSQFRSVFPTPGTTIPWGPQNTIPARIWDFRGNDPWLPTPWTNPDLYDQLNGVQRRWAQLEVRYQTKIFWLEANFKAVIHLEENPENRLYAFNNFCGWYRCQAEKCEYPRVDGRLYFFDLDSFYTSWKQLRNEQLLLDYEPSNEYAANQPSTDVNALEQTALRDQEVREQEAREQEARDQEARVQEAREQEASQVDSRPPLHPNTHFGLGVVDTQAPPKQSRWAQVFETQKKDGCAKAEVTQDVVPTASKNPVAVDNFGLTKVDVPVEEKKSRFTKFFKAQPASEQETPQEAVTEKTPGDSAPKAHFGLNKIEISFEPKKSRYASIFRAQKSTEQEVAPVPASRSDSEQSNEQLDSFNGSNKDDLPTPDTSIELLQSSSLNQEANAVSGNDDQCEEDEGDLYSASPLRGPSPAPTVSSQLSSITTPEVFMDGFLASRHQGNWQLYDEQGFLIDGNVENVGDFIIEDTMEEPGDDIVLVFGQVGFPIESPYEEPNEMLDGEAWMLMRIEDTYEDIEFEEVPEGVELLEDFFEDGWPIDEREEQHMAQTVREGLEEGNHQVIEVVDDFESYCNAPDSGWEAPEDSDASSIRGRSPVPKELNAKAYAQGKALRDQATEDESDSTESDSEDSDENDDGINPDSSSQDSDESGDDTDSKAQGSKEKDNNPKSEAQESDKVDENTKPKFQFSRIPIQARPAVSGLTVAFQGITGNKIGKQAETPLLGQYDEPEAMIDSEPLPFLQKDANMVHSSNMIRQIDLARDELVDRWVDKKDRYHPDGPTCQYVLKEGERDGARVCDSMPQGLVLWIQDSENKLWAAGATFAQMALAKKATDSEKLTTSELEFVVPGYVNDPWKPEFVAKCRKEVDFTDASLFLGENDFFTFDENKATF